MAEHRPRAGRKAQGEERAAAPGRRDLVDRRGEAKLAGPAQLLQPRAADDAAAAPAVPAREPGPHPVPPPSNRKGLPDKLKAGVEALSGLSMDDVQVHRNSVPPARLGALAYAQGSDIHLGPNQDEHLPHVAWDVVQQKQNRVAATAQPRSGITINDDEALECEADAMGAKAASGESGFGRSPLVDG
jgi:hypothetical protein